MEGKVESAILTFLMVMASIVFYVHFVKPYLPASAQATIGL